MPWCAKLTSSRKNGAQCRPLYAMKEAHRAWEPRQGQSLLKGPGGTCREGKTQTNTWKTFLFLFVPDNMSLTIISCDLYLTQLMFFLVLILPFIAFRPQSTSIYGTSSCPREGLIDESGRQKMERSGKSGLGCRESADMGSFLGRMLHSAQPLVCGCPSSFLCFPGPSSAALPG